MLKQKKNKRSLHNCLSDYNSNNKEGNSKFCDICGILLTQENNSKKKYFRSPKMQCVYFNYGNNSNDYLKKMHLNKSFNRFYKSNPNYLKKRTKFVNQIKYLVKSLKNSNETLHLAVAYVDAIFSICNIKKKEENLIIFTSFYIASKFTSNKEKQIYLKEAVSILNYNYSQEQIENCERIMVKNILNFKVYIKTPYNFLTFFLNCGILHNKEIYQGFISKELLNEQLTIFEYCCFYLLDISLLIYDCYGFNSDFVSATCIFTVRILFEFEDIWSKDLEILTSFQFDELHSNHILLIKNINKINPEFIQDIKTNIFQLKKKIFNIIQDKKVFDKNSESSNNLLSKKEREIDQKANSSSFKEIKKSLPTQHSFNEINSFLIKNDDSTLPFLSKSGDNLNNI